MHISASLHLLGKTHINRQRGDTYNRYAPSFCTRLTRNTVSPQHSPVQALLLRRNILSLVTAAPPPQRLIRGHRESRPLRTSTESSFHQEGLSCSPSMACEREPLFNAQTLGDVFHQLAVCIGDGLHVRDLATVKGLVARTVADKGCGFGITVDSTLDLG